MFDLLNVVFLSYWISFLCYTEFCSCVFELLDQSLKLLSLGF